jgi:hypothetical protein
MGKYFLSSVIVSEYFQHIILLKTANTCQILDVHSNKLARV